ncbi:GNAT family N-acetyltransferase [Amnibacterium flavum]|uniref:GNAT family N-acetyltransferase n=1 Tax=Amnibacterium flavum TaxID=2173173 RepID=A0A2V1HWS1_9MICO|nr:GNAT family N-acetyltransferase [Amnibacterium flavum]PVZ95679.1 GNAT family N-acetyltransferase [Amnibacterium flavum]
MASTAGPDITLRAWQRSDLPLLERINSPAMTEHLGGPESRAKVLERLERYLTLVESGIGSMFAIVDAEGGSVGSVGFWPAIWHGEQVWETGWSVLESHQGRGIATAAVAMIIPVVRASGLHSTLLAFPGSENAASNAVCRKSGFRRVGLVEIEYPAGSWMEAIEWRLTL